MLQLCLTALTHWSSNTHREENGVRKHWPSRQVCGLEWAASPSRLLLDTGCLSFLGAYQLTLISMTLVLHGNQSFALLCNALFTVGKREASHHPCPAEYWSNTGMGASTEEWALSYIYLWHRHCGHVAVLITITLVQCHNLLIYIPKLSQVVTVSFCSYCGNP